MNFLKKNKYRIIYRVHDLAVQLVYFFFRFTSAEQSIRLKLELGYQTLNLNRELAINNLRSKFKTIFQFEYNENNEMFSEHYIIFCALNLHLKGKIRRILEIGTHNGQCAKFLSHTFQNSKIVTIDLPDDEENFQETYGRKKGLAKFQTERHKNLKNLKNVEFIQKNSLSLTIDNPATFDLIWVDGSHMDPVVSIDIANAIRLISKNGHIIVDDVFKARLLSSEYENCSSWNAICQFKESGLIKSVTLIPKRISMKNNIPYLTQKYLAVLRT